MSSVHHSTLQRPWRGVFSSLLGLFFAAGLAAQPLLSCHVSYAGTAHTVQARPVADPYPVSSVDIGGRFRFKAVMVGHANQVQRILLYTYLNAKPHPVLIHQAKYLPPYTRPDPSAALTGQQYVYGGVEERELMYHCHLEGLAP